MPRNNGEPRKIERKRKIELRQIEINESGTTPEERAAARGFTHQPRPRKGPKS